MGGIWLIIPYDVDDHDVAIEDGFIFIQIFVPKSFDDDDNDDNEDLFFYFITRASIANVTNRRN